MKILWICNLILPEIAKDMGLAYLPKEGWVTGLLEALLKMGTNSEGAPWEIALAFPVPPSKDGCSGTVELKNFPGRSISYYGFYEDTINEELYDVALEGRLAEVFAKAAPDRVHCFGSEYAHTLAAAKVWRKPQSFLISIQGPCSIYAKRYLANLSSDIYTRRSFRDILKKDSMLQRQAKFFARGEREQQAMLLTGHIAGRTDFDKNLAKQWNSAAVYHHAGETLRRPFYSGAWSAEKAQKGRIFISQADYPLKGFHYLIQAVGTMRGHDEVEIFVAGNSIVDYDTLKEKIKISAYGKYLRDLIHDYHLESRVHILGRLSAEQMKEQYLKCSVYVCCSACENSPNSLGEAMMLQVPIVAAQVGGIPTMFKAGEDGWGFRLEPEDSMEKVSGALREALLECFEGMNKGAMKVNRAGEDLALGISEADYRRHNAGFHARVNHDPQANAQEMLKIYESMG